MSIIVELLQESRLKYADKAALRHKIAGRWVAYSYESVWETSDRIAAGLCTWGLEPGERAALLASSSPAWVTAYLGILKNNGIAVPIDKELKHGELRHVLSDSGARILFTEQDYLGPVLDIIEDIPSLEKIILLNQGPGQEKRLSIIAEDALTALVNEWRRLNDKYEMKDEDIVGFERLAEAFHNLFVPPSADKKEEKKSLFARLLQAKDMEKSSTRTEPVESFQKGNPPPPLQRMPDEPAVILYTSGTTGRSKGAMLSHRNIVSNVQAAAGLFKLQPDMHTLSFLPINHVFEQVAGIILPLSVGGTISFAESLRKLGDNLGEVKPNFLLGVPAVFRLLADKMTRKIEDQKVSKTLFSFPPTRPLVTRKVRQAFGGSPVFVSGGAALDPVVAKKMMDLGLNVFQGYGITETSPVIAVETPESRKLGTVGKPIPEVEVKIHAANSEGIGEIWVKGPNVMLGYYNNHEATKEAITDGWYHTGDLGCITDDGFLKICGRVKNLIVTANGKNVYPEEIENEISNSTFIAEIMVYGHKVDETSEEVYAMIYPDQDALDLYAKANDKKSLSPQEIEILIKQEVLDRGRNLADYKRIKRFTLRQDEFPKTTTRKIKRFVVEADIDAES